MRPAWAAPAIDPVVFFKLQLIMFFEGIRSARQLMDMVNVRLDHRWYLGYDLDEPVPDHSSLSRIRDRYGLEVFQRFFEHIVERCITAGLVWGKELYFDGTKVRANAAIDGMIPRFYWEARQHLQALFADAQQVPGAQPAHAEAMPTSSPPRGFVEKYSGERPTGVRAPTYKRTADYRVSPTDPDATPMKASNHASASLGYHDHYVVDGGKARIILAALVTPSSIMDNTPMLDLARWVRFRWHLSPAIAVGDGRYGTTTNIAGLEQDGIRAFLNTADFSARTGLYPTERFTYDPKQDNYTCPQGQALRRVSTRKSEQVIVYRAHAKTCNACPLKPACTDSKSGRHIFRSFFQEYLDRAKGYEATWYYQMAMRKRQVWVEPLFGEAKQWHGLRQFRLRGLRKVNIEGLMTAAGQNIKRLLNPAKWSRQPDPAGAIALRPPLHFLQRCRQASLPCRERGPFSTGCYIFRRICSC
ncbi:MAG: IS1182 family transposase [Anaerolineae bacterium]|nr:IS1182 family transposase [Anaerolineae bacterium]